VRTIKAKDPEVRALLKHFSPRISKEIREYARDEVFEFSRYIFTERRKSKRIGYCTHCHSEFPVRSEDIIQPVIRKPGEPRFLIDIISVEDDVYDKNPKPKMLCPACGSICTVKASGRAESLSWPQYGLYLLPTKTGYPSYAIHNPGIFRLLRYS